MDWHGADGSAPTNPVQGNAARLDHHFRSLIQEGDDDHAMLLVMSLVEPLL
jgi:hypothetical protein